MKITAFLLLAACMQVCATGLGQSINLSEKNAPLRKVFEAIEKQAPYNFVYTDDLLQIARAVTIDVSNASIEQVLDFIFKEQPLTYSIVDKVVVIKQKLPATGGINGSSTAIDTPNMIDKVSGRVTSDKGDPVQGAAVFIKGTNQGTNTDDDGSFTLKNVPDDAIIVITSVGYYDTAINVAGRKGIYVQVRVKLSQLDQAVVTISTGYQQVPKERATGSYGIVNSELLSRRVSTSILDKLDGNVTGLYTMPKISSPISTDPQSRLLGITIRGISTFSSLVGTDPLVVLDNFPYEGDINNINPNDIESVSILKDAAAASIWGAKAGNGVIVLTSKKGRYNRPMQLDITSNITIFKKPNIFKDHNYIPAKDYIGIEDSLFTYGYYDGQIDDIYGFPVLTPAVEILTKQRQGLISLSDAATQLNTLAKNDLRSDFYKYGYQKGVNQQYSVGLRGGNNNLNYSLSFGFDNNRNNEVRNGNRRITINSIAAYVPFKNLEITTTINYAQSKSYNNNGLGFYGLYPYAKLADAAGNPLPIARGYRGSYIDSVEKLGFLNWSYRPLDELKNSDNTTKNSDILLKIGIKYRVTSYLSLDIQYENEYQRVLNKVYENEETYDVRNLINQFTQYDPSTGKLTYIFPRGGMLLLNSTDWNTYAWRGQVAFNKYLSVKGNLSAITGAEIRELTTSGYGRQSYGYDQDFGTSSTSLDYREAFPTNPSGYNYLPSIDGSMQGSTRRYISYYVNAAYTYKNRYTISASARKDGSNIFGAKTNDRITPLWSAGASWDISREGFYHLAVLPSLKLRSTYGYNGNVYNGSAYATGSYSTANYSRFPIISNLTAPNPELRWEKIRHINIGIDFAFKKSILYGSLELYSKKGQDLIEAVRLAPSVGFNMFTGNAATTLTKGIELTLSSKIIDREFKWQATFIGNLLKDKVIKYDAPLDASSMLSGGLITTVGKPIYGLFSYKWAGLDAANGDPQGYLNGKISKDYAGIYNNYLPDSLAYSGSVLPTKWGTLRNDFTYRGFSLSFMIGFKFGYYFRKRTTSTNLQDLVSGTTNDDYLRRWQKPGDEKLTNVPSIIYPADYYRMYFYQNSEALVQKGDHIRLQDIRLSYDITKAFKNSLFMSCQVYAYANNLGIIWRSNKFGIDPDKYTSYPSPMSISFGIQASLK